VRVGPLWPGAGAALGPILGEARLFGHNLLVYLALALVPAVWWLLFRTRFGLRLRAVGENPAHGRCGRRVGAAAALCRADAERHAGALAGSYLVLAQNASFVPHMTAGRASWHWRR
jgi:general nucleoside transport system permease protein